MDEFPWLGYLFNTRNLNVHLDLANAAYLGMFYMYIHIQIPTYEIE